MPDIVSVPLPDHFVNDVLEPYKVSYVKKVTIEYPRGEDPPPLNKVVIKAELSIDEPCYIQDTGHFNAVEFTICYNMLVYMLIGYCVDNGFIDDLKSMDYAEFRRRQLSDVLIVDLTQRFRLPITSAHFLGEVRIAETWRKNANVLLKTKAKFKNEKSGHADGDILLAFINN